MRVGRGAYVASVVSAPSTEAVVKAIESASGEVMGTGCAVVTIQLDLVRERWASRISGITWPVTLPRSSTG